MMFLQESFTTSTALNLSFKAWFEHSQPSSQVIAQTLILITQSPNSQLFQPQELKSQLQKLQSLPQSLQTFHSFFLKAHQILIKTQSTPFFTHSSLPFSSLRSPFQPPLITTPKLKSFTSGTSIEQGKEMTKKDLNWWEWFLTESDEITVRRKRLGFLEKRTRRREVETSGRISLTLYFIHRRVRNYESSKMPLCNLTGYYIFPSVSSLQQALNSL